MTRPARLVGVLIVAAAGAAAVGWAVYGQGWLDNLPDYAGDDTRRLQAAALVIAAAALALRVLTRGRRADAALALSIGLAAGLVAYERAYAALPYLGLWIAAAGLCVLAAAAALAWLASVVAES